MKLEWQVPTIKVINIEETLANLGAGADGITAAS